MVAPIYPELGDTSGEVRMFSHPALALTDAEKAADVVPTSFAFLPQPEIDARRHGFGADAADAAANTAAIATAVKVLQHIHSGNPGGIIRLPAGEFSVNEISLPQFVRLRGAGPRATLLNYISTTSALSSGDAYCFTLGDFSGTVKYGCGVSDLGIVIANKDGHGVRMAETVGAHVERLYIEGYVATVTPRTCIGVAIDGGSISSYFNRVSDVICNHVRVGYSFLTAALSATNTVFENCSVFGDVSTYGDSIGFEIATGHGDGSVWIGGNIERCHIGVLPRTGSLGFSMFGTRFEANFVDITSSGGGQKNSAFFGLRTDTEYNVSDLGNLYTFIGCRLTGGGQWVDRFSSAFKVYLDQMTYSASMTPVVQESNEKSINVTNGTAFTINAPTGTAQSDGHLMRITIRNSSGGALGAVTWNSIYKLSAWTQPANGFSRSIQFRFDGVNWIEVGRTAVDVPN